MLSSHHQQNKWGKTLVDVSRISFADLEFTSFGAKIRVNAHRPFLVCDPSVKSVEYEKSIFRVQHYLGSWDAYSARNDIRRGREIFDERTLPVHHHTRLNRGLKRLWLPSEKAPPSPYLEVLGDNLATVDVIENLIQVRHHHLQNPVHFSSLDMSLKPLL
jgi:hypothetical protein